LQRGVPFDWGAADTIYGVGVIEMKLRRAGKGYVLGAHATDQFYSWIDKPEVAGTWIDTLVRVEGQRWAIEDAFETAKTELGLTHCASRGS
jgi:SRSO17 transposase